MDTGVISPKQDDSVHVCAAGCCDSQKSCWGCLRLVCALSCPLLLHPLQPSPSLKSETGSRRVQSLTDSSAIARARRYHAEIRDDNDSESEREKLVPQIVESEVLTSDYGCECGSGTPMTSKRCILCGAGITLGALEKNSKFSDCELCGSPAQATPAFHSALVHSTEVGARPVSDQLCSLSPTQALTPPASGRNIELGTIASARQMDCAELCVQPGRRRGGEGIERNLNRASQSLSFCTTDLLIMEQRSNASLTQKSENL